MRSYNYLPIATLMMITITAGLVIPTLGQIPKIVVEDRIIEVPVSTEFEVKIWIRDLPGGLTQFSFTLTWDPTVIEYVSHTNTVGDHTGWGVVVEILDAVTGYYKLTGSGPPESGDEYWAAITFHCLGAGSTPLNLVNTEIIILTAQVPHEVLKGAVTQFEPVPVGGVASPVNKLEILAPYIGLAGLIITVSAVYVVKRRKD